VESLGTLSGARSQRNNPRKHQYPRHQWRQAITVLGLNADLRIADLHAMIFLVGYGNHKRKQSKHQQDYPYHR
jgi:hypothetical protein